MFFKQPYYFDNLDKIIPDYLKQIEEGLFLEEVPRSLTKLFFRCDIRKPNYLEDSLSSPLERKYHIAHRAINSNIDVYSHIKLFPFCSYPFFTLSKKDFSEEIVCNRLLKNVIYGTKDYEIINYEITETKDLKDLTKVLDLDKLFQSSLKEDDSFFLCSSMNHNVIQMCEKYNIAKKKFIKLDWIQKSDVICCFGDVGEIYTNGKNFSANISRPENILLIKNKNHKYYYPS